MKGKREKYIDGMKGYACLFILLGHFMGIYKYAENADMIDSWFVRILTIGPLSFFSAESYWLYLFLVISGYLLMTFNTPHNYKEFVIKCAKRALRFVIPVIGTAIFIYILQGVIGFYNFDVQSIVQNKWLTNLYENPLTLKEVLEEPILVLVYGKSRFNSPFWCIRDMFISAVLIYAISIKEKTVERKSFWIILFIILFCLLKRNVIIACLIGAFTGLLKQNQYIQKISGNIPYFSIVFLIVAFIVNNSLLIDFSFAMLLLCIPKMKGGGGATFRFKKRAKFRQNFVWNLCTSLAGD